LARAEGDGDGHQGRLRCIVKINCPAGAGQLFIGRNIIRGERVEEKRYLPMYDLIFMSFLMWD